MGVQQEEAKKKNNEEEKKGDNGGVTTIVLKFDMHCEGCGKKVKRSILKHFNGVESVKADCGNNKLTVVGKVDPIKIKDRVEQKIKKKVQLISPKKVQLISPEPTKPSKENGGGDKKTDDQKKEVKPDPKKSEDKEKKDKPKEPPVCTVALHTRVHCEGCAKKIRKIVGKCEGVQDVDVELPKDLITVKGTMDMKELLPYLNVKLKRKVDLAQQPKKVEGGGGDKKPEQTNGAEPKKSNEGGGGDGGSEKLKASANKKEGGADKKEGGGDKKKDTESEKMKIVDSGEGGMPQEYTTTKIEVNKMEYGGYPSYGGYTNNYNYIYDPRQHGETSYSHQVGHWQETEDSHPPQLFSDENPNGCSIM